MRVCGKFEKETFWHAWLRRRGQGQHMNRRTKKKTDKKKLDPYICDYLFAAQLIIWVGIDLFEHIGRWFWIADGNQFNFENQCSTAGDDVASTTVTVAQLWWDGQFTLFTWNEPNQSISRLNLWCKCLLCYSPTHISRSPWSQPLITWPLPIWKENGWSRSKL